MSLVWTYPLALSSRGPSLVALAPVSQAEHAAPKDLWQFRVGRWLVPLELWEWFGCIRLGKRIVQRLAQTSFD
jgi:hypothetical protein